MWDQSAEVGHQRATQDRLAIKFIMACCVQAPVRSLMQMAAFVEPHVEAFAELPINSSDSQQEQVGFCVDDQQADLCPAGTGPTCSCMTWAAQGKLECT